MDISWIRLYWPAIVATVGGIIAAVAIPAPSDAGPFGPVVEVIQLAPLLFFAFALLQAAWVSYRVSQAERGKGPICPHCSGPLGGEINGRHGLYRKCLACGFNANERYWRNHD